MPKIVCPGIERHRATARRCFIFEELHVRRLTGGETAVTLDSRAENVVEVFLGDAGIEAGRSLSCPEGRGRTPSLPRVSLTVIAV